MKVTITLIAERAGVAKSTASLALRNDLRVKESTRNRVLKIAQEMGYIQNPLISQIMAGMRKPQAIKYQATFALIQMSNYGIITLAAKELINGFIKRVNSQGFQVDQFWLHETPGGNSRNADRIYRVLKARNIKAVAFYEIRDSGVLTDCEVLWKNYPCVVFGPRLKNPPLYHISSNQYAITLEACESILKAGYQRIGLIIDYWVDGLHQHRISAAYRVYRDNDKDWPPIFYLPEEPENNRVKGKQFFAKWIDEYRPDACLCVNSFVLDWIKELGIKVPDQMGIAFTDLNVETTKIAAGMNQQRHAVGAAGADVLIGRVSRNECGVPVYQTGTSVMGCWVPGPTIRSDRV